jgi:phage/plasmid-associated DNA primase
VATEKYRDEEDKILQFLTECCLVHPDTHVKAAVLYTAYKDWCKDNQFGSGVNATLFGNEVSRRFEKKTTKIGQMYQGIGLLAAEGVGEGLVKGLEQLTKRLNDVILISTVDASLSASSTRIVG